MELVGREEKGSQPARDQPVRGQTDSTEETGKQDGHYTDEVNELWGIT